MKTLFLLTLTLILSLNLNARENPFTATNAYEEESARLIEQNELDNEQMDEVQYIQEIQEKMNQIHAQKNEENTKKKNLSDKEVKAKLEAKNEEENLKKMILEKNAKDKILETAYSKMQVEKLIKKAQMENQARTKKLLQKEIGKSEYLKPKEVIYVKPRLDIIEEDTMKSKSILKFVKISYNNDTFNIDSKYKIEKKFTLEKDKKIIVDFKAKEQFSTKREKLNSTNYENIAIGNHKREGFFRVVIQLNKNPSEYKVNYNNNKSISIIKTNKMR